MNLNAGLIKLTLTDAAGKPASGKHKWQILRVPDTEGKQKSLAYYSHSGPDQTESERVCHLRLFFNSVSGP